MLIRVWAPLPYPALAGHPALLQPRRKCTACKKEHPRSSFINLAGGFYKSCTACRLKSKMAKVDAVTRAAACGLCRCTTCCRDLPQTQFAQGYKTCNGCRSERQRVAAEPSASSNEVGREVTSCLVHSMYYSVVFQPAHHFPERALNQHSPLDQDTLNALLRHIYAVLDDILVADLL